MEWKKTSQVPPSQSTEQTRPISNDARSRARRASLLPPPMRRTPPLSWRLQKKNKNKNQTPCSHCLIVLIMITHTPKASALRKKKSAPRITSYSAYCRSKRP